MTFQKVFSFFFDESIARIILSVVEKIHKFVVNPNPGCSGFQPYLTALIVAVFTVYIADITLSVTNKLWSWSLTIISLNSVFNPIIYCWQIKKLRNAFLEIVRLRQPGNSPPAIEMQNTTKLPSHSANIL